MGKPMAANIVRAGFPVTVYDVRKEPLAEMEKLGAKVARSARELGQDCDSVVVMVSDYPQVKEVVFPPEGVLAGMPEGAALIITSTISPREIVEVADVAGRIGVKVIDSAVSGGSERAGEGSLTFMVGGDEEVVKKNDDIFKVMGKHIYHVGKVGQGQSVKLINQILVIANVVSVAEAMVMAKKLGLNQRAVVEIVSNSGGDSWILREMAPRMIARDFEPKAAINIFTKDTGIIMKTGLELDVPLLISNVTYQVCRMAASRGLGQQDISALVTLLEDFAGMSASD
jgi:3-hydroxyisobutyrate dehydrogenase-like beta-hydroxyacid dehydrogenase